MITPFQTQDETLQVMEDVQGFARGERRSQSVEEKQPALLDPLDSPAVKITASPVTDAAANVKTRLAYAFARDLKHQLATRGALNKHAVQSALARLCDCGDVLTFVESP